MCECNFLRTNTPAASRLLARLAASPSLFGPPTSRLAHLCGLTLLDLTLSAWVESRRRLTLSPHASLTQFSPSLPTLLTPSSLHTCLTLLSMQISRRGWRMRIVRASSRRPGWALADGSRKREKIVFGVDARERPMEPGEPCQTSQPLSVR